MTAASLSLPGPTYSPAMDRTVRLMIVPVVTLIASMEYLTSYGVGVALPDIQGDLAASFDEGSWILTAYTTCFLIGLVLSNWMADRIGYRRWMICAVVLFTCSSVGCGMTRSARTWRRSSVIRTGGRIAVLTFHSLEDRIVKHAFRRWVEGDALPRRLPVTGRAATSARLIVRARRADAAEVAANPRARSAMLRVLEKAA